MSPETHRPVVLEDGLPPAQRRYAFAAILAALVLVVLDGAIANVALPTFATDLRVSPAASVWIVMGYQLALVVALLPCAALGDSFGHRRVFTAGAVVFTAASALCAASPSLPWLVAARFLQGLGGAGLMALGVALLRLAFPARLLGAVIGWNAMTIGLASAAGPSLGAAILSVASWPWLFAVNLPVGIVVLLASRALPDAPGTGSRVDFVSVALNAGTFAPLVLGVDFGLARPWLGVALIVVAGLSLTALIRREAPRAAPLIPLDLLRGRSFRVSVIASVCCFAGQAAGFVALPFYLQHGLGQTPFMAGLAMTPWPLTVAVAGPISGRLSGRVSTAWLCAGGAMCMALGLALAAASPLRGGLAELTLFTVLCGLGFGFFQTPNNRNMLLSSPRERSGAAGGMQGTARLVGQTVGSVIMALLFGVASVDAAPRLGLGLAAVLALVAGAVSVMRVGGAPASAQAAPTAR